MKLNKSPKSILLVATRQIGDVLLVTPLLRSLRLAYPNAVIDVLVYTNKGGMLEGNLDCNSVIESDEHPNWQGYWRLLRRITKRYDLAITTQANDRGHMYALIAGHKRIGLLPDLSFSSAWKRYSCIAWTLLDNTNTHTVIQNLRLADELKIARNYTVIPPQCVNADQLVAAALPWSTKESYVVLHPLPMWNYKRWNQTGWTELIAAIIERNMKVVITGGPGEDEINFCNNLANKTEIVNLAGKLPFGALSNLISHAKVFIGPDTSLTHLAAACGIPTLAIYGPSNPVKWGPWPANHCTTKNPYTLLARPWQRSGNVLLIQGVQPLNKNECVPCLEEGCDKHKKSESQCLKNLPATNIISALDLLLKDTN